MKSVKSWMELVAVLAVTVGVALSSLAATETVDGLTWTYVVSGGKASVGTGSSSETAVPKTTTGAIAVPSTLGGCPVTGIQDYAFSACTGLTSVVVSDSVTGIGGHAFQNCRKLADVAMGAGVKSIGTYAFDGCTNLVELAIGESVTSIGTYAFNGCKKLPSLVIPDSVTSIGGRAFDGCSGLTNAVLGINVTSIGSYAFCNCSKLSAVEFGGNEKSIDEGAFYGCGLVAVAIPDSVTSIGEHSFQNCRKLADVAMGSGVKSIGTYAFDGCTNLVELAIGESVTSIGTYAFNDCKKLPSVVIPDSVTSIGGRAFDGCSGLTNAVLGINVTSIGSYAFCNCSKLSAVEFGGSVKSIGEGAFSGCGLVAVAIPDSVTSIGEHAFQNCRKLADVAMGSGVKSIGTYAFDGCTNLVELAIGEGVTSIGTYAFNDCKKLPSVVIPDSVTSIGGRAFDGCSGLTNAVLGINVTSIGSYAFCNCSKLSAVEFGGNEKSIDEGAFYGCGLVAVAIPDSVTSIGLRAFYGCNGMTNATIGNGVTRIGNNAFYGCGNLAGVTIGNSVTNIGTYAFNGCGKLVTITFGECVKSLGGASFDGCGQLEEVWARGDVFSGSANIPWSQVQRVRYSLAFAKSWVALCERYGIEDAMPFELLEREIREETVDGRTWKFYLDDGGAVVCSGRKAAAVSPVEEETELRVPSTLGGCPVKEIGFAAFTGTTGLSGIDFPDSVTAIADCAFYGCSSLGEIALPASVRSIGNYAFAYGANLTRVAFGSPSSLEEIGDSAFRGCWRMDEGIFALPDSVVSVGSDALLFSAPKPLDGNVRGTLTPGAVYLATNSLSVAGGETLIIPPGTILKFGEGLSMSVKGTLDACGTRLAPVVFTSWRDDAHGRDSNGDGNATAPQPGNWHQVTGTGTVSMVHCRLLWCSAQNNQGGLYPKGGTWTFNNSTIAHCEYDCMRGAGGTFAATNSVFSDSSMGAAPQSGTARFVNCVFNGLTTAVRWGHGTFVNCIFSDIAQDILDTKFDSSTLESRFSFCCFWNPEGTGDHAEAKTGFDGNIYANPLFLDADGGDYRIDSGSPCVDAGDGAAAPDWDAYGRPRMDAAGVPDTGTPSGNGAVPDIGIYEVSGEGTLLVPDLAVVSVSAPETLTVGGTAEISWTVQNNGGKATAGAWRDEIELVAANGQVHSMGTVTVRGEIQPGGTASRHATVPVPAAPEGPVRIRVTANKHRNFFEGQATANNAGETAATLRVPELAVPSDGSAVTVQVAPGVPAGYSLSVPGGAAAVLVIRCDGELDAWLGNGSMASKDNALRTAVPVADGLCLLQIPAGGLPRVTLANGGDATLTPSLSLKTGEFFLLDTGMGTAANSGRVTVPFAGNGFDDSISCWLERGGKSIAAVDIRIESGVSASATFDVTGCEAGAWTLRVRKGSSEVTATQLSLSESRIGAQWSGEVDIPSSIRSGRTYVGTFRYGNGGDMAMPAPYVRLTTTGSTLIRLSEADAWAKSVEFLAASDTYPPSSLKAGDSSKVTFFYKTADASAEIEYGYTLSSDQPFPWQDAESEMRPSWATDELWNYALATLRANIGETWDSYLDRLRADGDHLMKIGTPVKRIDRLLQLELGDAFGIDMAVPALAAAADLARDGRGLGLVFSRVCASSLRGRFAKGVLGYGWADNFSFRAELSDDETLVFHLPFGGAYSFTKVSGTWQPEDARDKTVFEETSSAYVLTFRDGTVQTVSKSNMRTASIRDNQGNALSFSYSGDQLTKVAHTDGQTLSFTYSGGKLAKASDDQGRTVSYGYTGDLLTSVTAFDGLVTRYEYHAADGTPCARALERIVYPDGTTKEYAYDARGRVVSVSVNGGKLQTRIVRGACGSFSVIAPDGGVTEVTVGADGETLKAVDALGQTVRQTYTGDALLETITAPSGKRSRISWDKDGLPVAASSASGATTAFAFEPDFGNLASVTDAKGHAFHYGYDELGRGTSVVHADGSAATVEYNARGDVAKTTNRRGESIAFEYDAEGRMTKKTWDDGRTFSFAYDAKGNITNADDSATGAVAMEYDDAERLLRIEYPKGRGFTFAYDAAGRLTERASLDGTVERFAYDAFGRLASVTDANGNVWLTNAYDAATGWLATQTYGNGVVVSNAYDLLGRTVGIYHLKNGQRVAFFEYAYDEDDHCVSQTTAEGVERYTYDADGQLTGVTYPDGTREKFSYDAVGNRIGYDVNELNQYLSGNGATFTYDSDGNMTSRTDADGTTVYAYDTLNRLIAVTNETKGIRWSCEYDVFGNRTSVTDNGVTTEKVYLQGPLPSVAAEYVNGSLSKRHVLVGSVRLADVVRTPTAAQTRYYHGDLLGSTRLLTDGTGATKGTRSFKAFGETRAASGETTDAGYVGTLGVETDANGLLFMRNRYYDAGMGRFVQMDPIGINSGTLLLVGYCNNNAVTAFDPDGLEIRHESVRTKGSSIIFKGIEFLITAGEHEVDISYENHLPHGAAGQYQPWYKMKRGYDFRVAFEYPNAKWDWIKYNLDMRRRKEHELIHKLFQDEYGGKTTLTDDEFEFVSEMMAYMGADGKTAKEAFDFLKLHSESYGFIRDIKWSDVKISCDPNEISGPPGVGAARYKQPGDWMDYTIYFENTTNATAAAQEVFVDLPMDPNLDWNTLELGEIAFGDNIATNLVGKKHGQAEYPLPGRSDSVKMEVAAKDGVLRWYLRSWEPSTADNFPADAEGGFLPPNDKTHRGEGHIAFRVNVKEDAVPRAIITASAQIVFDQNPMIETDPAWWNTVAEMGTATADLGNGVVTNLAVMVGAPWGEQFPDPGKQPGMRFAGWFLGPNGSGEEVTAESLVEAGAKLYAFWDASTAEELWLDVS